MKYYINGFTEQKNYFFSVGNFTEREIKELENGEVVEKNGNKFWISKRAVRYE